MTLSEKEMSAAKQAYGRSRFCEKCRKFGPFIMVLYASSIIGQAFIVGEAWHGKLTFHLFSTSFLLFTFILNPVAYLLTFKQANKHKSADRRLLADLREKNGGEELSLELEVIPEDHSLLHYWHPRTRTRGLFWRLDALLSRRSSVS